MEALERRRLKLTGDRMAGCAPGCARPGSSEKTRSTCLGLKSLNRRMLLPAREQVHQALSLIGAPVAPRLIMAVHDAFYPGRRASARLPLTAGLADRAPYRRANTGSVHRRVLRCRRPGAALPHRPRRPPAQPVRRLPDGGDRGRRANTGPSRRKHQIVSFC